MQRRQSLRVRSVLAFCFHKVDPNRGLPPGHYVGDGHNHGGGAGGVDHHDHEEGHHHEEQVLPPGHYVGDGHNHGSGTQEAHEHGEAHAHEEHEEHGHLHEQSEQPARKQSANQSSNFESRFQRTASPSEQLRAMNPSTQSQVSQNSKETQARTQISSTQSSFVSPHSEKMASLLTGNPNVRSENAQKQGQALPGQTNAKLNPQAFLQKVALSQIQVHSKSIQGEAHVEGDKNTNATKISSQNTFISLLSGKSANVFLQSLPQALRASLGIIQTQNGFGTEVSSQLVLKNAEALQALFELSPKAFAEALESLQSKLSPEQILQQNRILGFQAHVPLTQISLSFAFPNLLQHMEKAWGYFSNLLFGNYLLRAPAEAFGEDLQMQELGALLMNATYRKKEKKDEVKKVKKKEEGERLGKNVELSLSRLKASDKD